MWYFGAGAGGAPPRHGLRPRPVSLQQAALRLSGGALTKLRKSVSGQGGRLFQAQTLSPSACADGPLPLTGGVRAASGPQRRPAGGESASHEMRISRPGSVPTFRLRLAAEGGAEGTAGARTSPARGGGPCPQGMVEGSERADARKRRLNRTLLRLRQGSPCKGRGTMPAGHGGRVDTAGLSHRPLNPHSAAA